MGKYAIYAIAQGVSPTTGEPVHDLKFNNWSECVPFISGVRFARYKGFMNEQDANEWLIMERHKRSQYPGLNNMPIRETNENSDGIQEYTLVTPSGSSVSAESSTSAPKATPAYSQPQQQPPLLNYQSGDMRNGVKFMFSERCMSLGLDPNEILLFLMEQWIDLADKMGAGLKQNTNVDEDDSDDFPPW